jgi:hypothetical protein
MTQVNDPKIMEALQALSMDKSPEKRTAIARLRGNYAAIEMALGNGVKLKAIWEEFEEEGYGIKFKTFESAVNRIRKEMKQPANKPPPTTAPEQEPATSVASEEFGLVKPPGITEARWSEMKAEERARKRNNQNRRST